MQDAKTTPTEDKMDLSAAAPGDANGDDLHCKFLAEVGALLEQLLRDEKRPEPATAALKEAAAKLRTNYKSLFQIVLRKAILKIFSGIAPEEDATVLQTRVNHAMLIVDYATYMLRTLEVDATLPASLMEYALSSCTLPQIAVVLPLLRARLSAIGSAVAESPATPGQKSLAKLELLKAAQMCVRRDNAGTDPAFSGRLRIALASGLPVWDPSGANKKGLRTDHGVTFADEAAFTAALKANIAARDGAAAPPVVDFVLYRTFWALQTYIADPFTGDFENTWPQACRVLDSTIGALESTSTTTARPSTQLFAKTPRYLTSPSLLPLQFADTTWRRHVLTQFLIFLFHVRTMGEEVTEPRVGDKVRWSERVPFCRSLFVPGGDGARLQGRILRLLRKDDPGGGYAAHVMELLDAERFWVNWKLRRSCPNLELSPVQIKEVRPLKRRRLSTAAELEMDGDPVAERLLPGMLHWSKRAKFFQITLQDAVMPTLLNKDLPEIYSRGYLIDKLEEDREEEDEDMKHSNDPKFEWLALRALRMTDLQGIAQVSCRKAEFGVDLTKLCPPVPEHSAVKSAANREVSLKGGKSCTGGKASADGKGVKAEKGIETGKGDESEKGADSRKSIEAGKENNESAASAEPAAKVNVESKVSLQAK